MKQIISLILPAIFSLSCNTKNDDVVILINLRNSDITKLYFTDAYKWDAFLDSATGGPEFTFIIPKEKLPESLCSIAFINDQNKIDQLEFDNRILSPDSTKYIISAFIPDIDTIRISGDLKKSKYYFIQAGNETNALFATQMMDFGSLDADRIKRTSALENYIAIIKKYPNSNYLLSKIYENKAAIKKRELELLLAHFNASALTKGIGSQLSDYAANKAENPLLGAMVLEDVAGMPATVLDTTAKLNVVILWASWCGPCRREIPEIKKIEKKYKDKGLHIVSVSVDDSRQNWQQALASENMDWKQLIVPAGRKQEFDSKFESSSIPDVIFTDAKGRIIERVIGFQEGQVKDYEAIINTILR